jgi:hypothetical protein
LFYPRRAEIAGKIFDRADDRAEYARSRYLIDSIIGKVAQCSAG